MRIERYKRQLPIWGKEGQKKISKAKVVVVGLGGLGSASTHYLTAAGIGTLGIVDYQRVQLSDLNRQILYDTKSIGKLKVEVAAKKLKKLNSDINIKPLNKKITKANVSMLDDFDIILDGTDNYETRFLLSEYCFENDKIFVYAAAHGLQGFVSVLRRGVPCLRCIVNKIIKPRGTIPIVGVTPAMLGVVQSLEALKIITSGKSSLQGKLLVFNGKALNFSKIKIKKNKKCKVCR
jgi:molybdopterin/thiamine biosynthesis adenylyltransferase